MSDRLFTEEGPGTGSPARPADPDKSIQTAITGVTADADEDTFRYSRRDGATVVPLQLQYGAGIKGQPHPYGDIQNGRRYVGKGVDVDAEPVEDGIVEPATRAWEKPQATVSGIIGPDTERLPDPSDIGGEDDFLEKVASPRKTLKYTLSGAFGRFSGHAEMVGRSEDGSWLGLVYSSGDSEYVPPASDTELYRLTAAGQTFEVMFTGIELPVGNNRKVLVFFKQ